MVTTNKKSAVETHINKKKQPKHNVKDSHQTMRKHDKKKMTNQKQIQND